MVRQFQYMVLSGDDGGDFIIHYSVVHIIRIRLISIFAYFEKTLGPTIETIQKIRMEKYG